MAFPFSHGASGMPLTVRHVHGTDGFVALPAHACEALLATQPALPLVLQLSSESGAAAGCDPKAWFVAWAGGSTSGAQRELQLLRLLPLFDS